VRGIDSEAAPLFGKDGAFGTVHSTSSWNFGRIPVEVQAAMGDSSVRRLSRTISPETMAALAAIDGGEELAGDR
jgi:hypothetical protein